MKQSPKTPLAFIFLLSLGTAAYGCGDTLNYKGGASAEAGAEGEAEDAAAWSVDPQQIEQDLTKAAWEWVEYSAALCGNSYYTWTFLSGGMVEHTRNSDVYPTEDVEQGCQSDINTNQGSFAIDETGVVRINFEGEELYAWQVGIFAEAPRPEYDDGQLEHTTINDVLTTHAYIATPESAQVFTQYIKKPGHHGQRKTRTTTLTFDAPIAIGDDCHLTVSMTARSELDDELETQAEETFDVRCRVEEVGLAGWTAIHVTEEIAFTESLEQTGAESILYTARFDYTRANSLLFYHYSDASGALIIHPDQSCCDSRWMSAN